MGARRKKLTQQKPTTIAIAIAIDCVGAVERVPWSAAARCLVTLACPLVLRQAKPYILPMTPAALLRSNGSMIPRRNMHMHIHIHIYRGVYYVCLHTLTHTTTALVTANSKLLESHEQWRAAQRALIKEEDTPESKEIHSIRPPEHVLPPLAAPRA